MLRLDHLAVSALDLEEGRAKVEAALGLALGPGGKHPHMSTHNYLLGLGDIYLEVIAADPSAPAPAWPRWFDLDHFAGPPRLTNWVCNCDDLAREIAGAPAGIGQPIDLERGDLRWRMSVPEDGKLPFDGAFPALIQWLGPHPVGRLPASGAELLRLEVAHPEVMELRSAVAIRDTRVHFVDGPEKALRAEIMTPHGLRVLE